MERIFLEKRNGTTPLTIGVILIIFLIALLFGIMFVSVNNISSSTPQERDSFLVILNVKNVSTIPKTVETGGKSLRIDPGESSRISISSDDILNVKTVNFDGSESNYKLSIPRDLPSEVYLTESGVGTNLTAKEGFLINHSNISIQFVEVGDDGRRWPKGLVGPDSMIKAIIPSGTSWQVINAERPDLENISLGSAKATLGTKKIVYDGQKLLTLR